MSSSDPPNDAGDSVPSVADERDQAGDRRDDAGDRRDRAADERDLAADERDRAAERAEVRASGGAATDALDRSAVARREAAADRRRASHDRRAGANERVQAELDRTTSLADRASSATERENACLDDLTGVHLRAPGFVELEREMLRARRTEQPFVLAFVDVDHLKAINDTRGHAAGDRMLLEVANTLRGKLRSHDLIIRYGGDEFVCAISGLNLTDARKRLAVVNTALATAPEQGSVSFGFAELQDGDSAKELVARADAALYRERGQQRRPTIGASILMPPGIAVT